MKILYFLILISVYVVGKDINRSDYVEKQEPVKGFNLPHFTRLNSLNVKPIRSRPYVQSIRQMQSRIAGGQDVREEQQGSFKHQVRVIGESSTNPGELSGCSGSILTNEWMITAAHCLDKCSNITMYFGMLDDMDQEFMVQRIANKANWFIHGNWSRQTFQNDIALVKLIPKLNFTEVINTIRLPRRIKKCTEYFGTRVTISGWGQTTDEMFEDSNLKYVEVNVVRDEKECAITWGDFVNFNTMICIDASQKRGACTGDSGGPLVYKQKNGLQVLIGLTSFGTSRGCETADHRVYTCINGYRDWIYNVTGDPVLED